MAINLKEETINFKEETIEKLKYLRKDKKDIVFIGTSNGKSGCSYDDFLEMSDYEYDNGYGGAEVLDNLVIVFKDGTYLYRNEYDGSEWWDYANKITFDLKYKKLNTLFNERYCWRED